MQHSSGSQICSHMGKLTKKTLQGLLTKQYSPSCATCAQNLSRQPKVRVQVCPHCGDLFCADKKECWSHHLSSTDHIFLIQLQTEMDPSILEQSSDEVSGKIVCKNCGIINRDGYASNSAEEQQKINRIRRFTDYILSLSRKIKTIIQECWSIQPREEQYPPVGFVNLGNTCFLNVTLQCLLRTPPFAKIYTNWVNLSKLTKGRPHRKFIEIFYDEMIQKQEENKWHVVSSKNKAKPGKYRSENTNYASSHFVKDSKFNILLVDFMNIFEAEENAGEGNSLEPIEILQKLGDYDKKYQARSEQDAEELLILILDLLSQGQLIAILAGNKENHERYERIQSILGRQKLTPTQDLFGCYLASRVTCLGCYEESWTLDFTYHLAISLTPHDYTEKFPEKLKSSMLSKQPITGISYFTHLFYPSQETKSDQTFGALQNFFSAERLTFKDNYFKCEQCSGLAALKQFYLVEPPPILIIGLKRFDPHRKKSKITKYVEFPEVLDVENVTLKREEISECCRYGLYGVIVHLGETIDSGHYICYVKRQKNWYRFSDETVRQVTIKHVRSEDAYLLLYQRQENPSTN